MRPTRQGLQLEQYSSRAKCDRSIAKSFEGKCLTIVIVSRHLGVQISKLDPPVPSPNHQRHTSQRNDRCEASEECKHIVEAHIGSPNGDYECHHSSHSVSNKDDACQGWADDLSLMSVGQVSVD